MQNKNICCVLTIWSHNIFTHLLQHNGDIFFKDLLCITIVIHRPNLMLGVYIDS
jgi:hypothetical protein